MSTTATIDTIHFRVVRTRVSDEQVANLYNILENRSSFMNERTYDGSVYRRHGFSGKYKNFKIRVNQDSITVNGSLAKYVHGNNVYGLDFKQTKQALYNLHRELAIPIIKSEVARIDIAENFIITDGIRKIFARLLDTQGYDRQYDPAKSGNGVRYIKGDFVFSFYDKTAEAMQVPGMPLPSSNEQILRIEMRVMKNVRRNLINKTKKFGAVYLLSENFHRLLAQEWIKHFVAIFKERHLRDVPYSEGWKEFSEFLTSYAIYKLGHMQAYDLLAATAADNDWDTRTYTNAKKRLRDSYHSTPNTEETKHIKILNTAVAEGDIYQLAHHTIAPLSD